MIIRCGALTDGKVPEKALGEGKHVPSADRVHCSSFSLRYLN